MARLRKEPTNDSIWKVEAENTKTLKQGGRRN